MGDATRRPRDPASPRLVGGLLITALGVILTLDNFGVVEAGRWLGLWPLIFVAIGLAKLTETAGAWRDARPWAWIVGGITLLGATFDWFDPWRAWPLVLVVIGVALVRGAHRSRVPDGAAGEHGVSGVAFMGGVRRSHAGPGFRGGSLVALLGACTVDLRQASFEPDSVTIDVLAVWGGIEIRVPQEWRVSSQAVAILGGIEDKTSGAGAGGKRLVISGLALMGGVEIKN